MELFVAAASFLGIRDETFPLIAKPRKAIRYRVRCQHSSVLIDHPSPSTSHLCNPSVAKQEKRAVVPHQPLYSRKITPLLSPCLYLGNILETNRRLPWSEVEKGRRYLTSVISVRRRNRGPTYAKVKHMSPRRRPPPRPLRVQPYKAVG